MKTSHPQPLQPKHYLTLESRVNQLFIFQNIGLFIYNQNNFTVNNLLPYKSAIKKKMFSFLYPNQIKKNILMKKRRILISRFFIKFRKINRFSLFQFKSYFKNNHLINFYNNLFNPLTSGKHDGGNKNILYTNTREDILYKDNFDSRGVDLSFRVKEVHVSRVKFKPGYQRL